MKCSQETFPSAFSLLTECTSEGVRVTLHISDGVRITLYDDYIYFFRKQQLYECDELSPFIHNCTEKFEKLEQVSIAKTLETFLRL